MIPLLLCVELEEESVNERQAIKADMPWGSGLSLSKTQGCLPKITGP
jgi:hypothetical protein